MQQLRYAPDRRLLFVEAIASRPHIMRRSPRCREIGWYASEVLEAYIAWRRAETAGKPNDQKTNSYTIPPNEASRATLRNASSARGYRGRPSGCGWKRSTFQRSATCSWVVPCSVGRRLEPRSRGRGFSERTMATTGADDGRNYPLWLAAMAAPSPYSAHHFCQRASSI